MTHWHVQRHSEDDDVFVTEDIYGALDYAATELSQLCDMEADAISGYGEAGMFEDAYNAWKRAGKLDNLASNAANVVKQHSQPPAERAPLYQGESIPVAFATVTNFKDGRRLTDDELSQSWDLQPDSQLYKHAVWVMEKINSEVPARGFRIWECQQETVTVQDNYDEYLTCKDYVL